MNKLRINDHLCRAIKRDGGRCPYRGKRIYAGFCGHHFPKELRAVISHSENDGKWSWPAIIGTASGTAALVDLTFRILQTAVTEHQLILQYFKQITSGTLMHHRGGPEDSVSRALRETCVSILDRYGDGIRPVGWPQEWD